ncbi:MAG: HEAT repeat domain-containing protein [Proteobacteria bacterium]|nr:HEAT repeat domain-containing protein [Pseudomonadota bacterium]
MARGMDEHATHKVRDPTPWGHEVERWLRSAATVLACTLALAAMWQSRSASAQPAAKMAPVSFDEAAAMLHASDPETVQAGIETLGVMGSRAAVAPLSARIRDGLPASLLAIAVDTLMVLGRPQAGPVLFELTRHRRPEIREKALVAIGTCRPRGAAEKVARALTDPDGAVRAAAAQTLAELGARDSIEALFLAFDRGVVGSETALGKLLGPGEVRRLLGYLGKAPLNLVGPAVMKLLERQDMPQAKKLEIISALQELRTPQARSYLETFAASPGSRKGSLRKAALRAAQQIAP